MEAPRRSVLVAALACVAAAHTARAQQPPLTTRLRLDGPYVPERAIGRALPVDGARPAGAVGVLRSLSAPVAVHVAPGVRADAAAATLASAERALDALEFALGFPAPLPDGARGGGPELDVYLSPSGPAVETVVDSLDHAALWDRASAFVRIRTTSDPAALDRAVAEGVARASILGAGAQHPRAMVLGLGAALAEEITGRGPDRDAWRAYQSEPGRALLAERGEDAERGAALFFDHLARRYGDGTHALLHGLVWGPANRTPGGWPRHWSEPDVLDVARRGFRAEPGGLPGVLLGFALARAVVGTVADPHGLAGALDPTLAARPLRVVGYPQLPVYLSPPAPLEPTGSAVVELDLRDAPLDPTVNVYFHGSPWRRWAATVARVGTDGRLAGRWDSALVTDGHWSLPLEALQGVTRVLVVVTDLGAEDLDPDDPPTANGFFALHLAAGR